MKKIVFLLGILIASVLLACATKVVPVEKSSLSEALLKETPQPGKEPWQVEWDHLIKEAQREGRLSLYTSIGTDGRQAISEGFGKKYRDILN